MINILVSIMLSVMLFFSNNYNTADGITKNDISSPPPVEQFDEVIEEQAPDIKEDYNGVEPFGRTEEQIKDMQEYFGNDLIYPKNNIYRNETEGYQITFPDEFTGVCAIAETEYNGQKVAEVLYMGNSQTCKNLWNTIGIPGMEIFTISAENKEDLISEPRDTIVKLGEAHGKIYYAHQSGSPFSLYISDYYLEDADKIDSVEYDLIDKDLKKHKSLLYIHSNPELFKFTEI